jgi:DMSO/TMAO reductase YedYZ molybdopterin-dependent catalytic subunit
MMCVSALAIVWIVLAPPVTVTVESLPFDPNAWKAMARVEVRVTENGQQVTYSGVPLRVVLNQKLSASPSMAALRALADRVLVISAPDGYQAAVSAAAVAMDPKGERYLLALERDGKPLGDEQGPVKLIVPGDSERVRWVRNVSAVDLIQMPRKERPAP